MESVPARLPTGAAAFGPMLASVASQAAIELDNRSRGLTTPNEAVSRLAEILRAQTIDQGAATHQRALLDPITAGLFGQVFATSEGPQSDSAGELKDKARRFAERLSTLSNETSPAQLRELRDFCVALANRIQAELEYRRESRLGSRFQR